MVKRSKLGACEYACYKRIFAGVDNIHSFEEASRDRSDERAVHTGTFLMRACFECRGKRYYVVIFSVVNEYRVISLLYYVILRLDLS